jgi:hypothetical protein
MQLILPDSKNCSTKALCKVLNDFTCFGLLVVKRLKIWKRDHVQQYIPQIDDCDSIVVETAGCLTLWLWDHR